MHTEIDKINLSMELTKKELHEIERQVGEAKSREKELELDCNNTHKRLVQKLVYLGSDPGSEEEADGPADFRSGDLSKSKSKDRFFDSLQK